MEILEKAVFFSKQGRASSHTHAMLFSGIKKRPKAKELKIIDPSEALKILQLIQKEKIEEENKRKQTPKKCSYAFRTVSRMQYESAYRNKTDPPNVGSYSPNYNVINPRVNQGPKFVKSTNKPREGKVFLPNCFDEEMNCKFPNKKSLKINHLNRTAYSLSEYKQKLNRRKAETPNFRIKIPSPINFNIQKDREPFVSSDSPPHEKRFVELPLNTFAYSNNKRCRIVSFNKMIGRDEVIKAKESLSPYDVKYHLTKPKTGTDIIEFQNMTPRTPNLIKQQLYTPKSPELRKFDEAFNKQSTVRG